MAKEESPKVVLERNYNIPLRRETLKVPPFRKANKAVKAVREFIARHMKSNEIVIGDYLNLKIWKHGAKNPPHLVKIKASKDEKGKVIVELADAPKREIKEAKKDKAKRIKKESTSEEKIKEHIKDVKEERSTEAKLIEKEEIMELKKEHPSKHSPKKTRTPKMQQEHPVAPKSL